MTGIPGVSNLSTMFIAKSSVALNLVLIGIIVLMMVFKTAEIRGLRNQIDDPKTGYKARLATANLALGTCRANNVAYRDAVRKQNDAIEALAASGTARDAAALAALTKVRQNPVTVRVEEIRQTKATGDLCASADTLIKESLK